MSAATSRVRSTLRFLTLRVARAAIGIGFGLAAVLLGLPLLILEGHWWVLIIGVSFVWSGVSYIAHHVTVTDDDKEKTT